MSSYNPEELALGLQGGNFLRDAHDRAHREMHRKSEQQRQAKAKYQQPQDEIKEHVAGDLVKKYDEFLTWKAKEETSIAAKQKLIDEDRSELDLHLINAKAWLDTQARILRLHENFKKRALFCATVVAASFFWMGILIGYYSQGKPSLYDLIFK